MPNAAAVLAYSLREDGTAWMWRVYDIEGELVAAGMAASKQTAQADLAQVYAERAETEPN
ncbi:MAG: hypothetical protein Q8M88_03985 [Phenylobacterium sp.]|nr:hypothetical protein [Phenylobacterium sp.]